MSTLDYWYNKQMVHVRKNRIFPRILLIGAIVTLIVLGLLQSGQQPQSRPKTVENNVRSTTPRPVLASQLVKNIFVPYWVENGGETDHEVFYYFGLGFDDAGNPIQDLSYQRINMLAHVAASRKMLVVRLLQDRVIDSALQDFGVQQNIVKTTLEAVEANQFAGAVLDLEKSYSFKSDTKDRISKFVHYFCTSLRKNYKDCFTLVYGDTYRLQRPYDIAALAKSSDRILVMAYDFHKAGGEPGPNFPFSNNYDYDFKQMVTDFTTDVPPEKLEIVFGMYGYDWTLNDQGTPLKQAQSLSLNTIRSRMEGEWKMHIYKQTHDPTSGEKSVWYTDTDERKHVVWYEDEESVQKKITYLLQHGIRHTSYWAYGYY